MTIARWDSRRDFAAHQEGMNRMLENFLGRPQEDLRGGEWVPAVDIYSNGQHELVLKAELPDMKEGQFELTIEENTLTLRGACDIVNVQGANNTIKLETAVTISVTGENNTVTYRTGDPMVSIVGTSSTAKKEK